MSTDLVHVNTFDLVPQAASLAEQIARTDFAPAGLRGKPEAVMAAMLQGHELGIGPMQALSEIAVINGKPCMSAKLMRALVQRAGHEIWFHSKSNTKVVMRARRTEWPEDRVAEVAWTMDDAKAAGLSGGQNYRKYPRLMLAARATGEICRDNFADVLGGIGYTPEELTDGDLIAEGDLVAGSRDDVEPDAAPTNTRKASRAAVKKAPAKKAAAPKAEPAPVADLPVPPLPGEEGFESTAEDAVVLADDARQAAVQALIDQLEQTQRTALGAWWKEQGYPKLTGGDLTEVQAHHIEGHIAMLAAGPELADENGDPIPSAAGRNRKMWAMVAEAWPDEDDEQRDRFRKALMAVVGDGASSSKDLDDGGWDDLFTALAEITEGRMELHLRVTGDYELRAVRGAA